MIIDIIKEIQNDCTNVIESNKARRQLIQNNLDNAKGLEIIFKELEDALQQQNTTQIYYIISRKLFFQEVEEVDTVLLNCYNQIIDKQQLINCLKTSYIARGIKGLQFAWTRILLQL